MSIKLVLDKSALESLIDGNEGVRLQLTHQAARTVIEKHVFPQLKNNELWKLTRQMTEEITKEIENSICDFEAGNKKPTSQSRWVMKSSIQDRLHDAARLCLESEIKELINKAVIEYFQKRFGGDNISIEQRLESIVSGVASVKIRELVQSKVTELVQEEINKAKLKLVDDIKSKMAEFTL